MIPYADIHPAFDKSEVAKLLVNLGTGVFIGGGAIRRELFGIPPSDYDVFFIDEDTFKITQARFDEMGEAELTRSTDTCRTYNWDGKVIQLINIQYYPSHAFVLDSFDFTLCQFVCWIDPANNVVMFQCDQRAPIDCARMRLRVHRITYAVSSMRRILKYANQGYTACSGMMAEFLQAVIDNPDSLNTDIVSVD
jgi:hypothetical protein